MTSNREPFGGDARRLLGTRLLTQGSDGLLQAALGTYVLFSPEKQASGIAVAVGFSVLLLPYSLIGPLAGSLLDRWPRRGVILTASLARSLVVLVIAALIGGGASLTVAAVVLVCLGLGRFVLAGMAAGLPHVVPESRLVTANAFFPTAGNIAAAIGTFTGAAAMSAGNAENPAPVLLGCAVGYACAAAVAASMPRGRLGPEARPTTGSAPIATTPSAAEPSAPQAQALPTPRARDTAAYLLKRPGAWQPMLVVILHRVAFGALTLCGLLMIRHDDAAGRAVGDAAYLAAAAGAGAFSAAMLSPLITRRMPLGSSSAVALGLALTAPVSYALSGRLDGSTWWLAAGALAMGFAGQWVKISADTSLQRRVADIHRGRTFTIFDIVLNIGLVSGFWLAAVTVPAEGFSPAILTICGVLLASAAALSAQTARTRSVPITS